MTPEESHEQIAEAHIRYDTMNAVVELLNLTAQYLAADDGSDLERLLEDAINDVVGDLMKGGEKGLGGHVMIGIAVMICTLADHEAVQEWLSDQGDRIQALVDEAHRGHSG